MTGVMREGSMYFAHAVIDPTIGDFDQDGFDDLATWADDTFMVDLANGSPNGWDGIADASFRFGFIGIRERPIAADMDQDGYDDLGLWVPDRGGITPRSANLRAFKQQAANVPGVLASSP